MSFADCLIKQRRGTKDSEDRNSPDRLKSLLEGFVYRIGQLARGIGVKYYVLCDHDSPSPKALKLGWTLVRAIRRTQIYPVRFLGGRESIGRRKAITHSRAIQCDVTSPERGILQSDLCGICTSASRFRLGL